MRDGVLLATDVYRPSKGRRWPVLLSRLPYDKAGEECLMPDIARWFTERGFAVVVQDVRGKVRSGGALAPFRSELADGYDTIDWITEQEWSAGPVGMIGDSYFGWTQWAAAASRHRALRAITPRVISADIGDILFRQGVLALEVSALWAFETWVDEALYDCASQLDWNARPLSEVVPTALGGRRSAFLDQIGPGRAPDAGHLPVLGDVPGLHIGGWWDLAQRGQLSTWRRARSRQRAPQFLMMDTVDHGWTHLREPTEPYVDPRGDEWAMQRFLGSYLGVLHPFLRHYLLDESSYDQPPVRWRLAHDSWHESEDWPPEGSRPVELFLAGSERYGALSMEPDRVERSIVWTHDPHDPVPSRAHAYHPLIDPVDEIDPGTRDDVLCYQTEPLRDPLDMAGPLTLSLRMWSSAPSTHIIAVVSDVAPDGSSVRLLDGAAQVVSPWPGDVTVELGSTGYRLRSGHRLRLVLSSSEFPRYALHPGTSTNPWTAQELCPSEQRIVVGGARAASLRCFALNTTGRNA